MGGNWGIWGWGGGKCKKSAKKWYFGQFLAIFRPFFGHFWPFLGGEGPNSWGPLGDMGMGQKTKTKGKKREKTANKQEKTRKKQ